MASSKVSKLKKVARQYTRHPSGTTGGRGGQFASSQDADALTGAGYTKTEKLGQGSFGEVYLTDRGTAVKSFRMFDREEFDRETRAYRELGALGATPRLLSATDREFEMEFLDGYTTLPFDGVGQKTYDQIMGHLHTMHSAGWVHNDIARRNTMVNVDGDVKLIDMGLAMPREEFVFPKDRDRKDSPEVQVSTLYRYLDYVRRDHYAAQLLKTNAAMQSPWDDCYARLTSAVKQAQADYQDLYGGWDVPQEKYPEILKELEVVYARFRAGN